MVIDGESGGGGEGCITARDSGEDDPNAEISGTNSAAVATSSIIEEAFEYVAFENMNYAVTADTTYCIVIGGSGYGDVSNYTKWGEADDDGGDVVERICADGDASGTWTLRDQYKKEKYIVKIEG